MTRDLYAETTGAEPVPRSEQTTEELFERLEKAAALLDGGER